MRKQNGSRLLLSTLHPNVISTLHTCPLLKINSVEENGKLSRKWSKTRAEIENTSPAPARTASPVQLNSSGWHSNTSAMFGTLGLGSAVPPEAAAQQC
jgi:hypothetical protein